MLAYLLDNYEIDCNMRRKGTVMYDYNYTTLMVAASQGNIEICQMLLERGADKTLKSSFNQTAYDIAVEKGHEDVAELLK